MAHDASAPAGGPTRTRISCPGCGRHDFVLWPANQPTYPWKCFNCEKSFELKKGAGH